MSYQSVITLVERAFVSHIRNQSWMTSKRQRGRFFWPSPATALDICLVQIHNQQPEQSGNFMASVELLIVGGLDPGASTYAENVETTEIGFLLHNYITDTLTRRS